MAIASQALWLDWNLSPSLVFGLALVSAGYLYVLGPWRRRMGAAPVSAAEAAYLGAALVTLVVALLSPLDTLGDTYWFSAHMVQHMLLAVVAPPLLLRGTPQWLMEAVVARLRLTRVLRAVGHPVVAFGLLNADLWLWHAPALYDLTLASAVVHVGEHVSFVVFGVLFWLPILGPRRVVPRISPAFGMLYLFLGCQPMVVLGAVLTFAAQPLYQPYVLAPRVWGMTPLFDQQLGGLIMWMPTNIPYLIGLSVLFFRWVGDQDRGERARMAFDASEPYELFPTASSAARGALDARTEH